MSTATQKAAAAKAAIAYVKDNMTLGVGTGSTTKYFIEYLAASGIQLNACIASSEETAALLKAHRLPVIELTSASHVDLYVDCL
jgi:ribose 5-phosphate isomerase A